VIDVTGRVALLRQWIQLGYIDREVTAKVIAQITSYPERPSLWERAFDQLMLVADYKAGKIKVAEFIRKWEALNKPIPGAARITAPEFTELTTFPPDMPTNNSQPIGMPEWNKLRASTRGPFRGGIGALPRGKSLSQKSDKEIDDLLNELAELLHNTLPTGPNSKTKTSHFVLLVYDDDKKTQIVSNLTQQELEKFMGQARTTYKPKPKVTRKIELED
jgi:hypothetical protein